MTEEIKKEESYMNAVFDIERPCTIAESIKQSCQEVNLMRKGMVPKRSWHELKHQLENDMAKDK